jgi:uncharacterized membrane protein
MFADEAAADAAVEQIKAWDKASDDVKLGAIGVLVKDEKGKIKTHKVGPRKTKGGAILGVLLGIVSGGVTVDQGEYARALGASPRSMPGALHHGMRPGWPDRAPGSFSRCLSLSQRF